MFSRNIVVATILAIFFAIPAFALDNEAARKFDLIMDMPLGDLGKASSELLDKNYPNENWKSFGFPAYVYKDMATEAAYKVAAKRPRLLGAANIQDNTVVIPCYCTCDIFGHDNLLYCFFQKGEPGSDFDEHGAMCSVCIRQALLAFLWDDLDATHKEIMEGMKKKFAPLIEKYPGRKH